MKELITRNFGWKLFALLAAIVFWLVVASEQELETIISLPVQYSHFPQDLEISSNIVESINVEARGPAGQLRTLADSRIAAVVDFAKVREPGERTFTLSTQEVKLPRGIALIRTIPAQLRFTFERPVTRAVRVEVRFSGKLPEHLEIARVAVDPPVLDIRGPGSRVMATRSLVSDPFDLSRLTGDAEQSVAVYTAEPQVRIMTRPQVTVKVRVRQVP